MTELSDLYQEVILDHSRQPRNFHTMENASRTREGYNPLCGDQLTLYLRLEGDRIAEVSFVGKGCAISKSSASLMTGMIQGKTQAEARALFDKFRQLVTGDAEPALEDGDKMAVFSGVKAFPTRVKCAVLAWHTLKAALEEAADDPVSTE